MPNAADPAWVKRYRAIESTRNQPGGFWVISASPEAAGEAVTWQAANQEFQAALLMSDGVSVLKDLYEPAGWADCFAAAVDDPRWVIDRTIQLELDDAACRRWPRSKTHDDKALASAALPDFAR